MPVMFVPAGVGLITAWSTLKPICVPVLIMTFISTVIVMVVTGKVTQGVIRMGKRGTENDGIHKKLRIFRSNDKSDRL